MRKVKYGAQTIEYTFEEKESLKAHYISVDKQEGVVLKGKSLTPEIADKLILKKASWILTKLEAVGAVASEDIVTGARLPYLGKSYYTEVVVNPKQSKIVVEFNYSRFKIYVNSKSVSQKEIAAALEDFYKAKAIDKITPRVEKLVAKTKLAYNGLSFRKMNKRWGSCTAGNKIILNIEAVKLPFSLIDYLIVHELCHTKVKDHSKAFWRELSKHMPNWRTLDERIAGWKY